MEYRLEDICIKVTDGSHFSPKDDVNSNIPMLSVKDMKEFDFDYSGCKHISLEDYQKMIRQDCVPKKHDVLVAKDGSYLKEIFVNEEENEKAILSSIAIFRPNKEIVDPYFLCYLLKTPYIMNYTKENCVSGSALPRIILKAFKDIKLEIPDIKVQKKIVKIIKKLNEKIILNNNINSNLTEISQILFEDFIKENENIEYCKIKDFNPRLEAGNRPKGGVNNITKGIPSIGAESIKGLGYFDYSKTKYVTEEFFEKMKKGIIQGYELLIYKDGGKPGYFMPNFSMFGDGFPYEKGAINEHVFLLDFKDTRFNIFSYYYFNSEDIRHKLHVLGSKSAAIPGINQQDILNLEIPHIKGIDEEVLDVLESNTRTIIKNSKQNFILTNMRDALLPKLMNGEINLDKIQI